MENHMAACLNDTSHLSAHFSTKIVPRGIKEARKFAVYAALRAFVYYSNSSRAFYHFITNADFKRLLSSSVPQNVALFASFQKFLVANQ
jgi:hypothetical protein